jgi:hypothetical protein
MNTNSQLRVFKPAISSVVPITTTSGSSVITCGTSLGFGSTITSVNFVAPVTVISGTGPSYTVSANATVTGTDAAATADRTGNAGLVPTPTAANAFLRGDGTWSIASGTNLYTANGTLTADRTVSLDGRFLQFTDNVGGNFNTKIWDSSKMSPMVFEMQPLLRFSSALNDILGVYISVQNTWTLGAGATGTLTIAAPTLVDTSHPEKGERVEVVLENASGGAVDISFDGVYFTQGGLANMPVTTLSSGAVRTVRFCRVGFLVWHLEYDSAAAAPGATPLIDAWSPSANVKEGQLIVAASGVVMESLSTRTTGVTFNLAEYNEFAHVGLNFVNVTYPINGAYVPPYAQVAHASRLLQCKTGFVSTGVYATDAAQWDVIASSGSLPVDSTVRTASFTAVVNNEYPCSTTGAALTVTFPAVGTCTNGDTIVITDAGANAGTNNITVNPILFHSLADTFVINVSRGAARFRFVNATVGWVLSA